MITPRALHSALRSATQAALETPEQLRFGAHTDSGGLTLLR